jgi:hypothetical protein
VLLRPVLSERTTAVASAAPADGVPDAEDHTAAHHDHHDDHGNEQRYRATHHAVIVPLGAQVLAVLCASTKCWRRSLVMRVIVCHERKEGSM